jgi:hypothetical protein
MWDKPMSSNLKLILAYLKKPRFLQAVFSVLVLVLTLIAPIHASATSANCSEKKLRNLGVAMISCGGDSQPTIGSPEGCISGKLPTITDETAFAAAMTNYVQDIYPRSPFLQIPNFGKVMVDQGKATGINPMLVIAIGAQESGMGQDERSGGINQGTHNAFGMTVGKNDPGLKVGGFTWIIFPSFEASLTASNSVFSRLKDGGYVNDPEVGTFERVINRWLTGNPEGKADVVGNTSSSYVDNATQTINKITSQSNSGVDCTAGGVAGAGNIVAIAQAELALNVHEVPDGSNCLPMVDNKYMAGICQSWCANFVSWVYKEAGAPFTGGSNGGWRLPSVTGVQAWIKANATWYPNTPGSSAPQPGDIVIFSNSGSNADSSGNLDHTGIVESVSGTTLNTIEGNSSNAVKRRTYTNYPSSNRVVGWGRLK